MSAIAIPIAQASREGVELDAPATSSDLYIPDNDGLLLVEVSNPTGGDLDITFTPAATVAGMAMADVVVSVPADTTLWLGPWPPAVFNAEDGTVLVSAASGLSVRGLRI